MYGGVADESWQVTRLGAPACQLRVSKRVNLERTRDSGLGLLGIGSHNLKIARGPQRNQRVSRSSAGMLSSWRRVNAQKPIELFDGEIEVRSRINEVIDSCQKIRDVFRLSPKGRDGLGRKT